MKLFEFTTKEGRRAAAPASKVWLCEQPSGVTTIALVSLEDCLTTYETYDSVLQRLKDVLCEDDTALDKEVSSILEHTTRHGAMDNEDKGENKMTTLNNSYTAGKQKGGY